MQPSPSNAKRGTTPSLPSESGPSLSSSLPELNLNLSTKLDALCPPDFNARSITTTLPPHSRLVQILNASHQVEYDAERTLAAHILPSRSALGLGGKQAALALMRWTHGSVARFTAWMAVLGFSLLGFMVGLCLGNTPLLAVSIAIYSLWAVVQSAFVADLWLFRILILRSISFWLNMALSWVGGLGVAVALGGTTPQGISTCCMLVVSMFLVSSFDAWPPEYTSVFILSLPLIVANQLSLVLIVNFGVIPNTLPGPVALFTVTVNGQTIVAEAFSFFNSTLFAIMGLTLGEFRARLMNRHSTRLRTATVELHAVSKNLPVSLDFLRVFDISPDDT